MKGFFKMFQDFWAFIVNPEARIVSKHKYPSGQPMSVRDARAKGLEV